MESLLFNTSKNTPLFNVSAYYNTQSSCSSHWAQKRYWPPIKIPCSSIRWMQWAEGCVGWWGLKRYRRTSINSMACLRRKERSLSIVDQVSGRKKQKWNPVEKKKYSNFICFTSGTPDPFETANTCSTETVSQQRQNSDPLAGKMESRHYQKSYICRDWPTGPNITDHPVPLCSVGGGRVDTLLIVEGCCLVNGHVCTDVCLPLSPDGAVWANSESTHCTTLQLVPVLPHPCNITRPLLAPETAYGCASSTWLRPTLVSLPQNFRPSCSICLCIVFVWHQALQTTLTSLRSYTLWSVPLFPWLWDLYLAGLWLYSQDDPVAFGGVFTIQGEEEFSPASCGRVLISLTPRLIHSVSISFSVSHTSALSLLDLFQLPSMLPVQPEQLKALKEKRWPKHFVNHSFWLSSLLQRHCEKPDQIMPAATTVLLPDADGLKAIKVS